MLAHMQKLMINTEDSVAGKALGINKLIVDKTNKQTNKLQSGWKGSKTLQGWVSRGQALVRTSLRAMQDPALARNNYTQILSAPNLAVGSGCR